MASENSRPASLIPLHIRLALLMIRRETDKPCDQSIERIKAIIKAVEAAEYDEAQLSSPSRDYVDPDKPF